MTERVIDWHGAPAVQISAFDISQQVAIEQMMLDNEQLLRAMLEILPVPIYIERRRDGRLLFVNVDRPKALGAQLPPDGVFVGEIEILFLHENRAADGGLSEFGVIELHAPLTVRGPAALRTSAIRRTSVSTSPLSFSLSAG